MSSFELRSRSRLSPMARWRLAVVVAAAGMCAALAVGWRIEGEGLAGAVLLALLSVGVLSAAIYGVEAAAGPSNADRLRAVAAAAGLMAGGFALGLGTLAPGGPVLALAAERPGASAALGPEVAGKALTVRVRGEIPAEARVNVDFVVAAGDRAVAGRLLRLKRHMRVGRRRATMESVRTFHTRLDLPDHAGQLRVTKLVGPLTGPLRVELLPQFAPPWAGAALAIAGMMLPPVFGPGARSTLYRASLGAGLAALAFVVGWARPAAELEDVGVLMMAGGILGGTASELIAHVFASRAPRKEPI